MSSEKVKVLLFGPVNGKYSVLFEKLEQLNSSKAGPFDIAFCTSRLLPEDADKDSWSNPYLSGQKKVSIPIYYVGEPSAVHQAPHNIFALGTLGLKTVFSLKIAYYEYQKRISGDPPDLVMGKALPPNFMGADIFLSTKWPQGVLKNVESGLLPSWLVEAASSAKEDEEAAERFMKISAYGEMDVASVATVLKPRYHVASGQAERYDRPPYICLGKHATRFVGLPPVGANKWIYAISIQPASSMTVAERTAPVEGSTPSPYVEEQKLIREASKAENKRNREEPNNNLHTNQKGSKRSRNDGKGGNEAAGQHQRRTQVKDGREGKDCWFCFSSPNIEAHLVASVGQEAYIALAKGGVNGDHCLIIPIDHVTSINDASEALEQEINQYKQALIKAFRKEGKEACFFERNVITQYGSVHMHIQCIPIPGDKNQQTQETFMSEGAKRGINLTVVEDASKTLKEIVQHSNYFLVELSNGVRLVCLIAQNEKHPLQFGRETIAKILGCPERSDWKLCKLNQKEETNLTNCFKAKFKEFDFTIDK